MVRRFCELFPKCHLIQIVLGGVIQQNYPTNQGYLSNNPQGFGWFGGSNQFANQFPNNNNPATFPKAPAQQTPNLFLPNFVPPVYYPNNYPYPTFPNFNMFPFAPTFNNNPYSGGQYPGQQTQQGGHGQQPVYNGGPGNSANRPTNVDSINRPSNVGGAFSRPNNVGVSTNRPTNVDTSLNRPTITDGDLQQQLPAQFPASTPANIPDSGTSTEDKYLTDAFFDPNQQTVDREWTNDDEMKWQATTQVPYFENKVPGLECTLPASAVLGATTALKASNLLPLNVPAGKPILSCNATGLLQAQISIAGIIYDCDRSAVTISCPRLDEHYVTIDECHGETLECDVRMPENTRSVSCTNGTLISNQEIVCRTATLMSKKNILNCSFKNIHAIDNRAPLTPSRRPTTPRPVSSPITSRPPSISTSDIDDIHVRVDTENKADSLMNEVQQALQSVFPQDLLSLSQTKNYLPPQSSSNVQFSKELKSQMQGVFPHELFAMNSQVDNNNSIEYDEDKVSRLSETIDEIKNNKASISPIQRNEWSLNLNTKTGNSRTVTKTRQSVSVGGRLGEVETSSDRYIFSS